MHTQTFASRRTCFLPFGLDGNFRLSKGSARAGASVAAAPLFISSRVTFTLAAAWHNVQLPGIVYTVSCPSSTICSICPSSTICSI